MNYLKFIFVHIYSFVFTLSIAGSIFAEQHGPADHPGLIIKRFKVSKGGDFLLIPVKFAGKDRLFVIDTGSSCSAVDESIVVGEPKESVTIGTPTGAKNVKFYSLTGVSIGGTEIKIDSAAALDLKFIRERSGYFIEGLLGMDFLGSYILQVDFDRGELLLMRSIPGNPGEAFPGEVFQLFQSARKIPQIEARVAGETTVRFSIDTGMMNYETGMLTDSTANLLSKYGHLNLKGTSSGLSISGSYSGKLVGSQKLSFGRLSVKHPIFSVSQGDSSLGLTFLSRFVVTFDFPGCKLFLSEGDDYAREDDLTRSINRSGALISRKEGKVFIDRVNPDSPASAAGLKAGEVLLSLGTTRADKMSLFNIRKAFRQSGTMQ